MQTLVTFQITFLLLPETQFLSTVTLLMKAGLISKLCFKEEFSILFLNILNNQNLKPTHLTLVKN